MGTFIICHFYVVIMGALVVEVGVEDIVCRDEIYWIFLPKLDFI